MQGKMCLQILGGLYNLRLDETSVPLTLRIQWRQCPLEGILRQAASFCKPTRQTRHCS